MATQKIETGLIADSAVTTAKLADNSVTAAKIAAGSLDDQVKGISSSADAVAITIDSSEKVGIGTDNPSAPLDLAGNFIFKSPANTLYGNFDTTTQAYGAFRLQAAGSNYGFIGQTSSLLASGGSNTALGLRSENEFAIATGGSTERMRIDSSGSLLVNTTSAGSNRLKIVGDASRYGILSENLSGYGAFNLKSTTVAQTWSIGAVDNSSNSDLFIYGGSSAGTKVTLASSGNVGIGTDDPLSKLDVAGNIRISDGSLEFDKPSVFGFRFLHNDAGNDLSIQQGDANNANYVTRLNINSSGNLQLGTTSSSQTILQFLSATNGANTIHFGDGSSADAYRGYINYNHTGDRMEFATSGTERMRIDSSGAVGIGQVPETARFSGHDILQVGGRATFLGNDTVTSTGQTALLDNLYYDASGNFQHRGDARGVAMQFVEGKVIFSNSNQTTGTPTVTTRMTLDNDGNVGIGLTAPTTKLHIGDNDHLGFGTGSATKPDFRISFVTATNSLGIKCGTGGETVDVTLSVTGDLTIAGALSKGSGSFKIDHPLESKKDTHHLVHSFVEAPQADNIYRGKVDLVDGSATVNIDTVAGMTEGTFIALNTNVQCFTSNESDWDAVKGSVSENILTISCQNTSSTATVSWLVIGERQDQHMLDTYWTDENGKVIVEPTK